jgi:hypothetical protein
MDGISDRHCDSRFEKRRFPRGIWHSAIFSLRLLRLFSLIFLMTEKAIYRFSRKLSHFSAVFFPDRRLGSSKVDFGQYSFVASGQNRVKPGEYEFCQNIYSRFLES